MSVDKGWLFFRVEPKESVACQNAFDQAIKQAQLEQKSKQFLCTHKACLDRLDHDAFLDSYELLYPHAITSLADDIFIERDPIFTWDFDSCNFKFVITNRIGAAEVLCYAIGWGRARRLPGYFGNLFIPPQAIADVLDLVEEILAEVDIDEFMWKGAEAAIGCCEHIVPELRSILPSALKTVLKEGNGLLALNYPDIGALPCPDDENDGAD